MDQKIYVGANDLLLDSFRLAVAIFESGFRPDYLVGLWRGGSAVGIAVQEGLDYLGVPTDHIAVRTSYAGRQSYPQVAAGKGIRVHGLRYLLDKVSSDQSILLVDDVYGTGNSVTAVIDKLARKARRNLPHDIRRAAVWYRPTERTRTAPDYYIHETDAWLVLPYELMGLTNDDIREGKPELGMIINGLQTLAAVSPIK